MRKYLLAAFVLLILGSTSLADEFFVTGQTNTEFCALVMTQCPQINYFLFLTAEPTPALRRGTEAMIEVVEGAAVKPIPIAVIMRAVIRYA